MVQEVRRSPWPIATLFTITSLDVICLKTFSEIITDQPYSVTSSPEVEDLYLKLRNSNPTAGPQLTPKLKWKICRKLSSASMPFWYQYTTQTYELAIDPRHFERELMRDHRRIFDELFAEETTLAPFSRQGKYRYENRSTLRKIFLRGNEYLEKVFTCLVRNTQYTRWIENQKIANDEIKQYYVSHRDYNVNELPDGEYITGRFLFAYNDHDQIVIHALAEENAYPILSDAAERRYKQKRAEGNAPTIDDRYDPVCKLNYGRRLRLCNSVVTNVRHLLPGNLRVDEDCVKKSFFLYDFGLTRTTQYAEWMIQCDWTLNTVDTRNIYHNRYYVSRGYSNNEIFMFHVSNHSEQEILKMIEYKKKVSVVHDNPMRFTIDDVED